MVELREAISICELMSWRQEVIRSVFGVTPDAGLLEANRRYYSSHIADGSHKALVASQDGEDCGCGSICLYQELPSPDNPSGLCAYLMNIYVRPPHRNSGIAHRIVEALISIARKQGCGKIYLETTGKGRPVYTSLGFAEMSDMMKYDTNN